MTTTQFKSLAQSVHPLVYRLTLTPDLVKYTFSGEEEIDLKVSVPTSRVVLNAVELVVHSASAVLSDGTPVEAENIEYGSDDETVTLTFPSTLPVGHLKLSLQFTGLLNDRLHGFYRSAYPGRDGTTQTMAATQFEPTDARRAFPCWDEPAVKAAFETTLIIPQNLTAVSNTPVASETLTGNILKRVVFRPTPPMSTYLLAFVVGELEYIEGYSDGGTAARVWTTPGKSQQGQFALDVAVRLLPFFNDYFGIPYPLEKLDHLAIPDFAAGAMENWGAITYRETALLYDPDNSSPATRQRIAEVVAHEMAHMWFGDLVTMAWWNDLWLNESFASWMGTKAVDYLFPEWNMWSQFIFSDLNSGLGLDGLENSHPIEQEVADPAQINQLFDAISYSKGASIIRMLEQFLGPEQFRKGLHRYLSSHTYGNARGSDLWQAMEEETGQPVVAMMDSWIRQVGYPVVAADVRRQGGHATVDLSQQRFLYSGPNEDPTLWQVPIVASGPGDRQPESMVMGDRRASLVLQSATGGSAGDWVKVNPGHTGFYRVRYESDEWDRFIPAIESLELPATDRLGLQSDAYALSRACLVPGLQFIRLAQAYKNEDDYGVWADLTANLRSIDILLAREPYCSRFQALARETLTPISQRMGWEPKSGEGHLDALLRSTALASLGAFEDVATLAEASRRFSLYLEVPSSLPADFRSVVYNLAAQNGDAGTFDTLHRLAQEVPLQEEKLRLYQALSRFRDKGLLEKTLELSLSAEVRSQDTVSLVAAVAGNRNEGNSIAWSFVKDHWVEFDRRYGQGGFGMMRLVGITGSFTSSEARQDVDEFFRSNPSPAATRTIQQSLERIDLNVRWLEHNRDDLARWFSEA